LLNTIIADSSPSVRKAWASLGRRTMTYEELMARLPSELQTEIRAATKTAAKSAIAAYYPPLIDRKRQELEDQELEHQQALEAVERWLREGSDRDDALEAPQVQETATPTRREMVLAVLHDFRGQDFTRRDVERKIIQRRPEVEPKAKAEAKTFTSGIAAVMTDLVRKNLVRKSHLEVRKGESRFDPSKYRLKDI
jgi:hypothetical protein